MYIKDRLRRSMMFVPGNNPGMIRDAHIYGADSIMFDLEDSVAYTEKDAARLLVYNALRSLNFGSRETVVRINDLSSGLGIEDLEAVVRAGVQVVRLPKTDSAQDVIDCEREIARIERESGIPVGTTGMMAAIESANGVLNAAEIARASNRLIGIALGAEDYVTDLKTTRSDGIELLFARCMILNAARAAGIAVTAEANLPPELSLTDLELSIVIGNLLDNAIEGCRSAAGEKFLRLSLRMKGDMLYFYLLNSAGKKQKKVGSLFRTGKTGAHGFGLHRAEAIVKQHGGWVKYNSEDGAFTSEFLVPAAC